MALNVRVSMSVYNSNKHKCVLWYSTQNEQERERIPNRDAVRILRGVLGTIALMWLYGNDTTGVGAVDNLIIPVVLDWMGQSSTQY